MTRASAIPVETHRTGMRSTLIVMVGWFFLAVWLGTTGRLGARGAPPFGLGLAITVPLLVFALDRRFGHHLLGGFSSLGLSTLVTLQTFRVIGVVFIVAWRGGTLPWEFALPAGIGDMAIGLTAPVVASLVADQRRHARAVLRIWNTLGVIDLVSAVTQGVLHTTSPLGVLAGPISTDAMGRYPLSVIPTFLVPLALILHYQTFRVSRSGSLAAS
jgi:hypothetical protein